MLDEGCANVYGFHSVVERKQGQEKMQSDTLMLTILLFLLFAFALAFYLVVLLVSAHPKSLLLLAFLISPTVPIGLLALGIFALASKRDRSLHPP